MLPASGTDTSIDVSVVICAYTSERWSLLCRAVASAFEQTVPPLEVIVVVDHNDDLLAAALREFTTARVIENCERRGLSGARNSGVAMARGAVVAFLDDDAVATPTWLEHLSAAYADASVAGVGGSIVPEWAHEQPRFLPEEFWWVVGCSYRGLPEQRSEVRNMLGANMSLRRSVFDRVGGFDSDLGRIGKRPVGCEETELCIRIQADDPTAVIVNDPSAVVHHHVPAERSTWKYFRSRCYAEGLSKARVSRLHGASDGLSSERAYVLRTLSRGLVGDVRDSISNRATGGLSRALAIVVGVAWTTTGYIVGSLSTAAGSISTVPRRPRAQAL